MSAWPGRAAGWAPNALAGALALCAAGCAASPDGATRLAQEAAGSAPGPCAEAPAAGLATAAAALSVVDRSLVGSPADYAADASLRRREGELSSSQRDRRELGWSIAARVLAPLSPSGLPAPVRAWQTWHNEDDLTRIFRRLYPELTAEEQVTRAPPSDAALDAAWRWNDGAIADFEEWTAPRLEAYRASLDGPAKVAGLGGVQRVAYSPAASRHLLQSYPQVLGCRDGETPDALDAPAEPAPRAGGGCEARPSFEPACLSGQFPASSVLIKASWARLDAGAPLAVFDTSASSLAGKLAPEGDLDWGAGDRSATPGETEIYTLETPGGSRFGLTGLHIMSKELEHWVWVTLWWSDDPEQDFGADRPASLGAPFDRYKLCVVTAFEEGDPDPEGGFAAEAPSLAAALAATHEGEGGATWCSNPYIELGPKNAMTNCIGCHQHAGTALRTSDILAAAEASSGWGRLEERRTFPADYVHSLRVGDDLGAMFEETEDHFTSP